MGRMSEKKFLLNTMKVPYEILQNNKPMHLIDVVILLNSLLEENEELKQRIAFFEQQEMRMEYSQNVINLINSLYEENEQLRQQQQRLYNYFRDCFEDEMSAENFGEMWDNVKEDERWNDE